MSAPSTTSTPHLSDTSYAVLGLLDLFEPATPYQLKQVAQVSIFHFWSIPHTQLYTECARLAEAGLLDERREEGGRRRRTYRLSAAGRKALTAWRADPNTDLYELRDPGLLKLFCGADPASLAKTQVERHERRLHSYQELLEQTEMSDGMRLSVEAGIGHEREYVRFWSRLQEGGNKKR
ncbi:MAG: PadR family transcriptional regulator [Actinomycetota bacterium]